MGTLLPAVDPWGLNCDYVNRLGSSRAVNTLLWWVRKWQSPHIPKNEWLSSLFYPYRFTPFRKGVVNRRNATASERYDTTNREACQFLSMGMDWLLDKWEEIKWIRTGHLPFVHNKRSMIHCLTVYHTVLFCCFDSIFLFLDWQFRRKVLFYQKIDKILSNQPPAVWHGGIR